VKRIFDVTVVLAPVVLAIIAWTAIVAPRLVVSGTSAAIIYCLFWICSAFGFLGSIALAAARKRFLWLIATISTTLLFAFILLISAGLAMSRWH